MIVYRIEFDVTDLPKLPNVLSKSHWMLKSRHNKHWRNWTAAMAKSKGRPPKPLNHATITYERHSASEPDFDGLVASFKPLQDGLRDAGIIVDDTPEHVSPSYQWRIAKRKKGFVRIIVEGEVE